MAKLVDYLLLIISNLNRENNRLNNEIRSLKKIAEEGSRKKKEGCVKSEITFNDLLDRITGGESPSEFRDDIVRFLGQMAIKYEIHARSKSF